MKKTYKSFLIVMFSIIISSSAFADVSVDGYCYLDGETNHSGTKVLFSADSPTASTDSVFTIADGSFSIGLSAGIYQVSYSHDGWVTDTIAGGVSLFASATLDPVTLATYIAPEPFREVSGPQSGIWTSDSIYHVIGLISIENGDSLVIEPGTVIEFKGQYSFNIYGLLTAIGTQEDSILFTSGQVEPSYGDWGRIGFYNGSDDNSMISLVNIEHAIQGLYCNHSSPTLCNNNLNNNRYGIECVGSSNPLINSNTISNIINTGILCSSSSSPIISNNNVSYCNTGISCSYSSSTISNNIITNNSYTGISCSSSSISISNNIIANNNYYGITCFDPSSPTINKNTISNNNYCGVLFDGSNPFILNNILLGNETGVIANSQPSSLEYNLFWENNTLASGGGLPAYFGEIIAVNANLDSCDAYLNLFMDPLIVDPDYSDFRLMPNSPCINAGNPDPVYNDPDGTIADIGALYFDPNMPIASFDASATEGYFPLTVDFTDLSVPGSASIAEWYWAFGDGNTSALQNPTHIFVDGQYNHIKSFTVSLVIVNSNGLADS